MTLNDWNKRTDLKNAWKAYRKSEAGDNTAAVHQTEQARKSVVAAAANTNRTNS